jgi:membrane-associated protein
VNEALIWILSLIQSVDPLLRSILAGTGMFLETSVLVGLVVPGDTIVIVASTAVAGLPEYLVLVTLVIAGSLGGESVGFALGRYFGPKIKASRLGQRLGAQNWARAERYIDRRGGIAVFISRFLPVFHSLVPLTVGMSTMRYRKFLAWTAPACVLWTLAYISVGWAAADNFRNTSGQLHFAGYVFVGGIVAFLALVALAERFLAAREARHMDRQAGTDDERSGE